MIDRKLYLTICIANILKLALFVALAMFFHRWGIALFAILFMTSYETKTKDY